MSDTADSDLAANIWRLGMGKCSLKHPRFVFTDDPTGLETSVVQ